MQFFKARQLDMHILQTLWHFQASFHQFSSVLILDLKRIADEVKATTVVLQGQQPRHSNSTLSNRALLPFAYQWAQQRNKGMAENHTKSLV